MPPIDDLPGLLIIPNRDDLHSQYLRDVRIRTPDAATNEGTLEYADGLVFVDQQMPVYFDVKNIGDYVANVNKKGKALDAELKRAGTSRLLAAGGFGFVTVGTSSGGGTIFAGDEIKDLVTGLRYQCTATRLYTNGQPVPIIGVDTGPSTNLPAGTKLQWTFPRPGISPNATIVLQSDGSGLSGGRDDENDSQATDRLTALRSNPPASGNDADIQKAVQECPGVTVQQCFTYPCILGPGTMGVTFTIRPGTPGANRCPNDAQLSAVHAWLVGKFPADDSILMCMLISYPVTLIMRGSWAPTAVAWADAAPWPLYNASFPVKVDGSVYAPSPLAFRLTTGTSTVAPEVGKALAFYDQPNATFRRKRILSVSVVVANLSWDIVVDESNNASDTNYTPLVNQLAAPWSDSLQTLVTPISTYFDSLGPGEQLAVLPDPNLRQRRTPRSPAVYANTLTNRIITPLFSLPAVNDVELVSPAVPYNTPTGAQGIASFLLALGSIVVFPQA